MNIQEVKNTKDLIAHIKSGQKVKYLFFWGHKKKTDHVSKECLSQWYEAPFVHEEINYKTAEHFMMIQKAKLFDDHTKVQEIIDSEDAGKAKAIGRAVNNFDQAIWDKHKVDIVVNGNIEKFSQNLELKTYLINTGQRVLVEASPIDRVWGVGLETKDPLIENPENWLGQNLLGFALMEVRKHLTET